MYYLFLMKLFQKVLFVTLISFLFLPLNLANAQILINKRTGDLSITTSEGDLFTVSDSDALPKLSSGAVIEVLSGAAAFKIDGSEILTVVAGESVMNLIAGNEVAVTVSNSGVDTQIHCLSGNLQISIGEVILTVKSPALLKANIADGKSSVVLTEGDAAIVEFGGSLKKLAIDQSYDLGSIAPTFSEDMAGEMEAPESEKTAGTTPISSDSPALAQ